MSEQGEQPEPDGQPRPLHHDEQRMVDETDRLLGEHAHKATLAENPSFGMTDYGDTQTGRREASEAFEKQSEEAVAKAREVVKRIRTEETQPRPLEPHEQELVESTQEDYSRGQKRQLAAEAYRESADNSELNDDVINNLAERRWWQVWKSRDRQEKQARRNMRQWATGVEADNAEIMTRAREKAREVNPPLEENTKKDPS